MTRLRVLAALTLGALLLAPAPSAATTSTPRSFDRREWRPVAPLLARALETARPSRHILRSIAIDLDRDGDLDVIASTLEEPVVVWLNDGMGRFVRERPAPLTQLHASNRLDQPTGSETAQSDPGASKWPSAESDFASWTSPDLSADRALPPDALSLLERPLSARLPRGPPPSLFA